MIFETLFIFLPIYSYEWRHIKPSLWKETTTGQKNIKEDAMKLGWTNLLPEETKSVIGLDFGPVWNGFNNYFKKITKARPGTEIQIYFPEQSSWTVHFPYIEFLNNRWFVEAGWKAEKDGCDAVVVGAATDTVGVSKLYSVFKYILVKLPEMANFEIFIRYGVFFIRIITIWLYKR